jgi:GDPmannose 4,6-dehydratase
LRGETFVTRKITRAAAAIKNGQQDRLYLGNLDARRDWGHAREYVRGMWLMLQQDEPDDYVLATGETHSVREMIELAFSMASIKLKWRGTGADEVGYDEATNKDLIFIDPKYYRPTEVDVLWGDASKAERVLGWRPHTSFQQLIAEMVAQDTQTVYTII